MEDKREESEDSKGTVESGIPGNTTEEEGLANLAESIHINPPVMATMTEPTEIITERSTYLRQEITGEINSRTGHRTGHEINIADDEAALR